MPKPKPVLSPGQLDAKQIVITTERLSRRILERFPESGLSRVAVHLQTVARASQATTERLGSPVWPLRLTSLFLQTALIGFLVMLFLDVPFEAIHARDLQTLVGFVEPALGTVVFLSAFILFAWSLEVRWKRRRALAAVHELRSLAHIVDMHQLTKAPEHYIFHGPETSSSPTRSLTAFQLSRYFDYCSEMLSLIGKIAALYAQVFDDEVALAGVDQIEGLTTGLSRKIWQKMTILDHLVETGAITGDSRVDEQGL